MYYYEEKGKNMVKIRKRIFTIVVKFIFTA